MASKPLFRRQIVNSEKRQLEASENGSAYSRVALSGTATTGPLAQAEFFIGPVSGDDSNSGASASEAIAGPST